MNWEGTRAVDSKSYGNDRADRTTWGEWGSTHVLCPDGDVFIRQCGQINFVFHHRLGL